MNGTTENSSGLKNWARAKKATAKTAKVSFGDLHRYSDGEYLRAATADEYAESRAAGFEGVIMVGDVACYVE